MLRTDALAGPAADAVLRRAAAFRHLFILGLHLPFVVGLCRIFSDLPVFPLLGPASRHDLHGFAYTFFSMKKCLPDVKLFVKAFPQMFCRISTYEIDYINLAVLII